jgi:hypothetical protein
MKLFRVPMRAMPLKWSLRPMPRRHPQAGYNFS